MAITFPTTLDSLTNPTATDGLDSPDHATQHANANDAIEALEAKVGADGSSVTTSHDYKLSGVTSTDKAVSLTGSETLTNKTLTSPVLNTGVSGTAVLDDDTMATASNTTLATSESIKAYVDTTVTAEDLDTAGDTGTGAVDLDSQSLTIAGGEGIDTTATDQTITIAGEDATTANKGIASFDSNHFSVTSGAVSLVANGVDDTLIDWGTGAGQVSAGDVPIADAGVIITATDVEGALQENRTALDLNTTHRTSDGSDHSFIDQSVVSGASPTFDGNNFTGIDANDVDIADAGGLITATDVEGALQENRTALNLNTTHRTSNGTDHSYIDQDVTSGSSPTFDGANFSGISLSKSITVENPTSSEDISIFFTNSAITITEIRAVLVGSSTPSVTWTVRHGTDRSAAGAEAVTSGTTTTSTTTGSDVTSFNDATVVADSFVWLETTAQSGTVTELHITIVYDED